MNRCGFLSTLAAGFAIDPEKLLWRPGAKMISIPAAPKVHQINIHYISSIDLSTRTVVFNRDIDIKPGDFLDFVSGGHSITVEALATMFNIQPNLLRSPSRHPPGR